MYDRMIEIIASAGVETTLEAVREDQRLMGLLYTAQAIYTIEDDLRDKLNQVRKISEETLSGLEAGRRLNSLGVFQSITSRADLLIAQRSTAYQLLGYQAHSYLVVEDKKDGCDAASVHPAS